MFIVMRKLRFQGHARRKQQGKLDFLTKKFRLKPAINRTALRCIERVKAVGVKTKGRERNRTRTLIVAHRMRSRCPRTAVTST